VLLDSGAYSLIQNLGDTFPGGVLTYTTRDGDTLQGIASQMYGNPSLWFVIADANGLNAGEQLKAGKTLTLPNSVKTGNITADNHRVYSESEIVGSTLPNLKTPPPPPPKHGCGSILMIIIIVVIAVVAAAFVGPLALALLNVVGAAGALATVAAYAVAGALIAAAASIVQQGLFIALGYQESFSWKQVGNAAIAGAISGAAQGIGAAAQAAAKAGQLSVESAQYAKVASAALKASSVAVKQILDGGKITSWTSLASAAIGGYLETGGEIAKGANYAASTAETQEALNKATAVYQAATQGSSVLSTVNNYATPWVQLAETYVRNDHQLTPTDWANAAGSTFAQAVSDSSLSAQGQDLGARLYNSALRLSTNLLVAGALRHYDKNAADAYFDNSVGQVVGQFIGDTIGQYLKPNVKEPEYARIYDPTKGAFVDRQTKELVRLPSEDALVFQRDANGQYVDQTGNPAPVMYADSGQIATDAIIDDSGEGNLTQELNGTGTPAAPAQEPEPAATPTAPASREVQRGDSLYKIAKEVYGDANMWPLIAAANGIATPDLIRAGQELTLPPKEGFDEDAVHALAGKFYADKEQARQAREEAMAAAAPASGPVAAAPAGEPAPVANALAEGRSSMRAYWEGAQENAVKEGSLLKYMGASIMQSLGDFGYNVAEMGVGVYNDPKAGLVGAGKSIVNFGPEAFNGAVNLTKTSLNGLTLLAETAGVPQGTFAGFRETDPYNITPLLAYNGKGEQGGAFLANLAIGAAVTKYGSVELGGGVADSGALRQTGAGGFAGSADEAYSAIRNSTTDVGTIAENTGIKPSNIQKVKEHIFNDEHLLDRYESLGVPAEMRTFDSSAQIADAWKRLETGTHTPADIQMLRHETAEAWYMRKHGPSYDAAHSAAQRRYPSGLE